MASGVAVAALRFDMATRNRLSDVCDAIRSGALPRNPLVRLSTVLAGAGTACSMCQGPLGSIPAFELAASAPALLDAKCFSAWLDVTVVRQSGGDMSAA